MLVFDHGNREKNQIALVFDDGPNPFWTQKVLDVLDEHKIKANFFVLGKWAEKHPDLVKETFDRGHMIGNHTYSHPKEGFGDFEKAEEIISKIIGENTKFIRPPYLRVQLCNCHKPALENKVKIITTADEDIVYDWEKKSDFIKDAILGKAKNGFIIFLHDGSNHEQELETRPQEMFKILSGTIEVLQKQYEFVRLDQMDLS